jgi:hypothetical protein
VFDKYQNFAEIYYDKLLDLNMNTKGFDYPKYKFNDRINPPKIKYSRMVKDKCIGLYNFAHNKDYSAQFSQIKGEVSKLVQTASDSSKAIMTNNAYLLETENGKYVLNIAERVAESAACFILVDVLNDYIPIDTYGAYAILGTVKSIYSLSKTGDWIAFYGQVCTNTSRLCGTIGGKTVGTMLGSVIAPGVGTIVGSVLGGVTGGLSAELAKKVDYNNLHERAKLLLEKGLKSRQHDKM